ncbi:mevalonate kinase [bacterium]|nr:mevalonate kinase [bacterium]
MSSKPKSSCAKFILLGEHSIVHKGIALSIPLPNLRLAIEILDEKQGLFFNGLPQHEEKRLLLSQLSEKLNIEIPTNVGINIVSDIPIGSGLGSSGALCCSLIKTFHAEELSPNDLANLAIKGEDYFHGKSSGVDPFTIALERPIAFSSQNHEYKELSLEALHEGGIGFFIVDSQSPHSTSEIIKATSDLRQRDPNKWQNCIDALAGFATEGKKAIDQSKILELGRIMNDAHEVLRDYGVSNSVLDELVKKMRDNGALGAKMTGAGKGGSVIALLSQTKLQEFTDLFARTKTFSYFP